MHKRRLETQDLVVMYTQQHLTMEQIAKIHGVTRAAVNKRLKLAGVKRSDGTFIAAICDFCGKAFNIRRARWRKNEKAYCGRECFYASIANPNFVAWRQGSRIARALVDHWFKLDSDNIVHHVDFDERNNDLDNLEVYASSADHMAMHRGRQVEPIWRGKDQIRTPVDPIAKPYDATAALLRANQQRWKQRREKWAERAALRQVRRAAHE